MAEGFRSLFRSFGGGGGAVVPVPIIQRLKREARNIVVPLARETYERREEQNFREWSRRNINKALNDIATVSELLSFANIPVYANDAAAGTGGLVQGQFYRTATGVLMVKL